MPVVCEFAWIIKSFWRRYTLSVAPFFEQEVADGVIKYVCKL